MIRLILTSAAFTLASLTASACDIPRKRGTTLADMPPEIFVAYVKVQKAKISSDGERQWSQLHLIEPLRGELPQKIRVLSRPDAASCGYGFIQGEKLVVGSMRRKGSSHADRYPYTANAWTEHWAGFFQSYRH